MRITVYLMSGMRQSAVQCKLFKESGIYDSFDYYGEYNGEANASNVKGILTFRKQ